MWHGQRFESECGSQQLAPGSEPHAISCSAPAAHMFLPIPLSLAHSFPHPMGGRCATNACRTPGCVGGRLLALSLIARSPCANSLSLPNCMMGEAKSEKKNAEGCCKLGSLAVRGGRESSLSNSVNKTGYFIQIQVGPCKCEAAQPRQVM